MFAWFDALPVLSKIFVVCAAPATIILVIQTIMLFFGHGGDASLESDVSGIHDFGSHGADFHAELNAQDTSIHDTADFDAAGLRLFTVRGIFAFLALGGWTGVFCLETGMNPVLAIFIAFVVGAASLYLHAKMMQSMMSLQESGNIDYRKALGRSASVYLTIPASGGGQGKINVELSGALGEYSAVTNQKHAIKTGAIVRIVDLMGDVFVVEQDKM